MNITMQQFVDAQLAAQNMHMKGQSVIWALTSIALAVITHAVPSTLIGFLREWAYVIVGIVGPMFCYNMGWWTIGQYDAAMQMVLIIVIMRNTRPLPWAIKLGDVKQSIKKRCCCGACKQTHCTSSERDSVEMENLKEAGKETN